MKITTLTLFISLFFSSCIDDASRDNPLDPQSPNYTKEGSLSGRIIIANQSSGISGVTVWNFNESISVTTDSLGNFSFGKLSAGMHRFVASKSNFLNDTFSVTINSGVASNVVRGLNGAPVVMFQRILTRKVDQFFPSTMYFVDIEAVVTDPNGVNDLNSVWFAVESYKFPLTYNPNNDKFISTLDKGAFPTNTIQWLVGKPLFIVSTDDSGAVNSGTPFYITRVIENAAVPLSPTNNEVLKPDSIFFSWSEPDVTFNFTYTVNVSIVSGITYSVWTKSGLNATDQPLQFPTDGSIQLSSGNYVWSVFIVDEFGNSSRSKEYPFSVVQ